MGNTTGRRRPSRTYSYFCSILVDPPRPNACSSSRPRFATGNIVLRAVLPMVPGKVLEVPQQERLHTDGHLRLQLL